MRSLVVLGLCLSLWSCKKNSIDPIKINHQVASMSDLVIPDNFNFGTAYAITGEIQVKDLEDKSLSGIKIAIYDSLPEFGGSLINSGLTDVFGVYKPIGVIPAHLNQVVIICHAFGFPNVQTVEVTSGLISVQFGGSSFKASKKSSKTSGVINVSPAGGNCYYMSTYNSIGVPNNFLATNDPIDQTFLNMVNTSLPERNPVPIANSGYLATGNETDIDITQTADVWITFVHEGAGYKNSMGYYVYNTTNPPATAADIDSIFIAMPNTSFAGSGGGLYSGNKIYLGQFGPNTSIGWVIFQNAWNGSSVNVNRPRFYSNPDLNPESTASARQHNVQLYDNSRDVILIGFEDLNRQTNSDEDFNDLIFYVSANPITSVVTINIPRTTETATDTDQDGVIDASDDYPNDPAKAFNNWAYGTLAFEDMWPFKGDYDFNDLVTGYSINQITNGEGKVVEIKMDLEVKAVGAAYTNALAFMLGDLTPSDIQSVSGQHTSGGVGTSGIELNQNKAVIVAIDDVYDFLGRPEGAFFNTLSFKPSEAFKLISIDIVLASPKSASLIGLAPFNAFIVPEGINGSQARREIHLAGMHGSDLVDSQLFGQNDDNTNPALNNYYKSNTNLPWAMNITSTEYKHVLEYEPIINAYHHFANWAQTSGGIYNDWYMNKSGYRNVNKIFN